MNSQKKSIEIGDVLIMLDGWKRLWIYNKDGEGMTLRLENIKKLEILLNQFFDDNF